MNDERWTIILPPREGRGQKKEEGKWLKDDEEIFSSESEFSLSSEKLASQDNVAFITQVEGTRPRREYSPPRAKFQNSEGLHINSHHLVADFSPTFR